MRVLVLGGTGMAGHMIAHYFAEKNYDVTVFARKRTSMFSTIEGDALDFMSLGNQIINNRFDVVINAIGILNQYADDNKSNAILLNSFLPHYLSEITKETAIKIIHISTDCVFSGSTGGYSEDSIRDGQSFYDRTKALGELNNVKDLTFRTSIIGPDINKNGIGLFNWFMKQSGVIYGYKNSIWTGVTTLTLAEAMEKAIQENIVGLYNLVNNDIITKLDLLRTFKKYFKSNVTEIQSFDNKMVNKSLITTRNDFKFIVPSYEQMIKKMAEWMEKHKDLYPHYSEEKGNE